MNVQKINELKNMLQDGEVLEIISLSASGDLEARAVLACADFRYSYGCTGGWQIGLPKTMVCLQADTSNQAGIVLRFHKSATFIPFRDVYGRLLNCIKQHPEVKELLAIDVAYESLTDRYAYDWRYRRFIDRYAIEVDLPKAGRGVGVSC